jgi:hypothetical protein
VAQNTQGEKGSSRSGKKDGKLLASGLNSGDGTEEPRGEHAKLELHQPWFAARWDGKFEGGGRTLFDGSSMTMTRAGLSLRFRRSSVGNVALLRSCIATICFA